MTKYSQTSFWNAYYALNIEYKGPYARWKIRLYPKFVVLSLYLLFVYPACVAVLHPCLYQILVVIYTWQIPNTMPIISTFITHRRLNHKEAAAMK